MKKTLFLLAATACMLAGLSAYAQDMSLTRLDCGTPQAPTPAAVRTYLREFLSDPRVIEIPRILWWPILNFVVLTTRPGASARDRRR